MKAAPAQQPSGMGQPPSETGRRNVRLLILLLGVVSGLLVASILFVAFRR